MEYETKETRQEGAEETPKKSRHLIRKIIIAAIVVLILFLALINFITDFLWFRELGYVSVFLTKLFTQLKIGIPVFLVVTIVTYIYFKFLKRSYYKKVISNDVDRGKAINYSSWGLAALFGAIVTYMVVTRLWFESLQFTNSTSFGLKEGLFKNDASFYVFKLDFIQDVTHLLIGLLVVLFIMTLIYYAMLLSMHKPQVFERVDDRATGADFGDRDAFDEEAHEQEREQFRRQNESGWQTLLRQFMEQFQGGGRHARPQRTTSGGGSSLDRDNLRRLLSIARNQLIGVGVIFFLAVAVHFFLKQYDLLYQHTGAVYGAGYTDVKITLWIYRVLAVLAVVGALAVIWAILKKRIRPVVVVPVIMIIVGVIGSGVGSLVQNFVVSPDEIKKESKYLDRNIQFTQYAYNLNNVETKSFAASKDLTSKDIQNNEATISNIRINDYKPAMTFYNQTQAIRLYYNFNDVDVDRYMVNGKYTQTFLSARELDEERISSTWLNTHLKYTHGYGATVSQVNQVTASGQPSMLISDIPPVSKIEETTINRPEIYFGESTNDYIMVQTREDEFDYPDGDSNKYAKYEGSAGIKMNPLARFMFAVRERSLKLLVSSNINSKSRIVINRNIQDRVETIMPYLSYEKDPYMCTVNGKLYWIIDAYTYSNRFPYSEPYDTEAGGSDTNYLRNSVKVVIDAYNGDTNYYIVDEEDPVAQTMQKIYPKLFKNFDDMPDGIREHIRYPGTMFNIQAKVYERYHMNDVKVFYQNEDAWDIAKEIFGTEEQETESTYYILNLPGFPEEEEFVNSISYTPKDKRNMTGIMMARNDGENYGQLVLYKLPKNKVTYGPMQIEGFIDQNTEISKEFSLWSQAGSTYSRGNLFVIPIEDSLLYVEPVYLEAKNSSIPEVKRVIVAYGDEIAYEPTLAEALDAMFGEGSGKDLDTAEDDGSGGQSGDQKEALTTEELAKKAQDAYEAAQKAQKDGDWAEYGKQLDKLEEYLNEMVK